MPRRRGPRRRRPHEVGHHAAPAGERHRNPARYGGDTAARHPARLDRKGEEQQCGRRCQSSRREQDRGRDRRAASQRYRPQPAAGSHACGGQHAEPARRKDEKHRREGRRSAQMVAEKRHRRSGDQYGGEKHHADEASGPEPGLFALHLRRHETIAGRGNRARQIVVSGRDRIQLNALATRPLAGSSWLIPNLASSF